ncbi:MAG: YicC/YloC family endoribonuclease [Nitritalea sp.]
MIKSMTGFGTASFENELAFVHVEVKTLNSKFLDLSMRYPKQFSAKELEIRQLVSQHLERGKVSLSVEFVKKQTDELPVILNKALFERFYREFSTMALSVGAHSEELIKLALQAPGVMHTLSEKSDSEEQDWALLVPVLEEALRQCNGFREDEGASLMEKFQESLQVLREQLEGVRREEPIRRQKVRSRITTNVSDWLGDMKFDENRFEQELIYYFEKIDITEEIVRLETHLNYFEKTLLASHGQGKKLGFISQEIGREINTIGSKANDAAMQKHVILMKDELEKIKEQSLNIL